MDTNKTLHEVKRVLCALKTETKGPKAWTIKPVPGFGFEPKYEIEIVRK